MHESTIRGFGRGKVDKQQEGYVPDHRPLGCLIPTQLSTK
uniref:Uncharacterized protein n=1 Tax=Rhizophora mucronata TaxID=61149 RepID=A0A2P2NTT0_RHIMU